MPMGVPPVAGAYKGISPPSIVRQLAKSVEHSGEELAVQVRHGITLPSAIQYRGFAAVRASEMHAAYSSVVRLAVAWRDGNHDHGVFRRLFR